MASHQPSDQPLQELKHDAVPGYPVIFTICFAVMSLYLGFILYSSPGQAEHGHHDHKGDGKASDGHSEIHNDEKPH